ncbi:hypothetical protein FOMPIDRAFT_1110918 [Fomitopsis schrenkii]|uniref:Tc1-like transposase DDE domain-containing protein n=1 Tax=Fomitopsis schrenkii TaxID=2126942 RepID=S8EMY6_FOMSC|nr:hypothetical protein FOMPIDRAFT_1110918 [Fomitopsis schrenkii]
MHIVYLPPYSPDLNPIEQAFSAIKAYFRRVYPEFARSRTTGTDTVDFIDVYQKLFDAVFYITQEHAQGFFHHSGYM